MEMMNKDAALVVGASGGIGRAVLSALAERQRYGLLFATSRNPSDIANGAREFALDLTAPDSIARAAEDIRSELDRDSLCLRSIYICSGVLHGQEFMPERKLDEVRADVFARVMAVNATGPLLAVQAFAPLLPRREATRIAAISARVGSISDNARGGWYSYRCSKAALNMALKTASIELKRTRPGCVVTLYQPGTVDTGLSGPFQRSVPDGKLFSPEFTAKAFLDVLDKRDGSEDIDFVDWAGESIPY